MATPKQTIMGPRGPEKTPGYYSWRHRTREAQDQAAEKYNKRMHEKRDRKRPPVPVEEMTFAQVKERIGILDGRLGVGVGASRERSRLSLRLLQLNNIDD